MRLTARPAAVVGYETKTLAATSRRKFRASTLIPLGVGMEVVGQQMGRFLPQDSEAIEIVQVPVTVRLEGADGCGHFIAHGRQGKPNLIRGRLAWR